VNVVRFRVLSVHAFLGVVLLVASACGSGNPPFVSPAAPSASSPASAQPTTSPVLDLPSAQVSPPVPSATPSQSASPSQSETLPRDKFTHSTTIDNEWFALRPGTQFVWEGKINVDEERLDHRVIATVTDLTKTIDGIRTLVVYEQDFTPFDERAEAELSFFAQDDDGTVWLIGEYPEEYDNGKLAEAPTWLSGIKGSVAGIAMTANPRVGQGSYSQGWAPSVGFTDRARVFEMGSKTCVRSGCFGDVLIMDEFNPDEPDAHQLKYYALGVGVVRVGFAGALEDTQEVLGLVKINHLGPSARAKVRAAALNLEKHAYQVSKDVYGLTSTIEPSP
jgi:hypothetical protein